MRKANQQIKTTAEVSYSSENAVEKALDSFDANSKARSEYKRKIVREKRQIRAAKETISSYSRSIKAGEEVLKKWKTELAALPESTMTVDEVKALFGKIAGLPWVAKVKVGEDGVVITTATEALKTVFHRRIVYKNGERAHELLQSPLTLPMPTYNIFVKLTNLGNSFHRSSGLAIQLAEPETLKSHPDPDQLGLQQAGRAHWASNETRGFTGDSTDVRWGELCLSDYDTMLHSAGKTGIIELLNEIVMFLQGAGWAHAYRSKLEWAATLGFYPYFTNLLRPMNVSETYQSIQADTRRRLPEYLKQNGLTQHEYDFGSLPNGERLDGVETLLDEAATLIDRAPDFGYTIVQQGYGLGAGTGNIPLNTTGVNANERLVEQALRQIRANAIDEVATPFIRDRLP